MREKAQVKRMLAASAVFFVSLLLGEGILRLVPSVNNSRMARKKYMSQVIWLDEYTRLFRGNIHHEFEEAYRPEGEQYFSRAQPRLFRTDENGFILGSKTEPPNFTKFQVLFSGGSVVECQEVDEPFRFPFVVQSILREEGLSEILTSNLGIRGHTTFETIKLMTGTSLFDGFQAIVFMHNINDWTILANCGSYFSSSSNRATGRYGNTRTQVSKIIESAREDLTSQYNTIFLLHNLYRKYFSSEIFSQCEEPGILDDDTICRIRQIYNKSIVSLAELAHGKYSKPIFLTQPSPFEGGLQGALNEELKEVCAINHYELIDVAGKFPHNSAYLFFPDGVHLNNEGSILVGQIVAQELPYTLESELSELPVEKEWLAKFQDMLTTGSSQKFAIPNNSRYPVLTDNLERLYFQSSFGGKSQICCLDLKSGLLKRLSPFALSFWHPCPNAKGVYAVSDCLNNERIFNLTGQEMPLLPIFNNDDFEGAIPACGPNGLICFPGSQKKGVPDLFIFSPQDNKLEQITQTICEEWRPTFHPDQRRIFYICNEKGNFDIYCYDLESKTTEFVVGTEGDDWDVDVSPDGNLLVFASQEDGNFDLMLYDLMTKQLRHLTNGVGNEWDPRFSPNGKIIMYAEEIDQKSSVKFLKVLSL